MFKNLRCEMARKGYSIHKLSQKIGMSHSGLKSKLWGTYEFNRRDMMKIQKEFPECSVAYLFDLDEYSPKEGEA